MVGGSFSDEETCDVMVGTADSPNAALIACSATLVIWDDTGADTSWVEVRAFVVVEFATLIPETRARPAVGVRPAWVDYDGVHHMMYSSTNKKNW